MNISHIYSYGPSITWVVTSHGKTRHFGALFTPHMTMNIAMGNTHIDADGPHYYMGNTHVKLMSHKKGRHFDAKLLLI